jgi:hypothetical protein
LVRKSRDLHLVKPVDSGVVVMEAVHAVEEEVEKTHLSEKMQFYHDK